MVAGISYDGGNTTDGGGDESEASGAVAGGTARRLALRGR